MPSFISILYLLEIFVTLFFPCNSLFHPLKTFVPAGHWRVRGSNTSFRGIHIVLEEMYTYIIITALLEFIRARKKKAPSTVITERTHKGAVWESLFLLWMHTHQENKRIVSIKVQHIKCMQKTLSNLVRLAPRKCVRNS